STGPTTPSRWATWRANSSTDPPSCRRAASRSSGADARRPRPAARARGGDARHGDVRDAVFVVRLARTNVAEALVPGLEVRLRVQVDDRLRAAQLDRSEEHTSELQSRENLVCRLLLEKKKQYRQ